LYQSLATIAKPSASDNGRDIGCIIGSIIGGVIGSNHGSFFFLPAKIYVSNSGRLFPLNA